MSQDRRRPIQSDPAFDLLQLRRLQLAPYAAGTSSADAETTQLAALLRLLSEHGIDCEVILEAAEDFESRTLH